MVLALRDIKGGAQAQTLASQLAAATTTTFTLAADPGSSWPSGGASGSFVVTIDRGTASEEKILCSARSGATCTIAGSGRGYDGTSAALHAAGAAVEHTIDAALLDDLNSHVYDTSRNDHCFSEDTELLTTDGWIGLDGLYEGLPAWTFNLETEQAELEPIAAVYRYSAEKFPELVSLENQDMGTFLVTPEHSVIWKTRNKPWRRRPAHTLPKQFMLPAAAQSTDRPGLPLSDEFIQLIAWAATEGHWTVPSHAMRVAQKAGPFADRIRSLLVSADVEFSEYKQRGEMRVFSFYSTALAYYLDEHKTPRRDLLAMSSRQARLFLGDAVMGDGHVPKRDKLSAVEAWQRGAGVMTAYLASINGSFIDFCQELCVLNGIKSRVYEESDPLIYKLAIKQTRYFDGVRRDVVPNFGEVWCVSVPTNQTVIVRRAGSSPVIFGNTQYLQTSTHNDTSLHTVGGEVPAGVSGDISASAPGDTAAAGSTGKAADAGHRHPREAFGSPAASAPGDAQSAGSGTAVARANHVHAREAFAAPAASAVGDSQSAGSGTDVARANHVHAREGFGNVTAATTFGISSGNGAATTVARSDHTHGTPGLTVQVETVGSTTLTAGVATLQDLLTVSLPAGSWVITVKAMIEAAIAARVAWHTQLYNATATAVLDNCSASSEDVAATCWRAVVLHAAVTLGATSSIKVQAERDATSGTQQVNDLVFTAIPVQTVA